MTVQNVVLQGMTADLLAQLGFALPTTGDDPRFWLFETNKKLGRLAHGVNVLRGVLLEVAYRQDLWQGVADSWSEYCASCGVNEYEASRLRTISKWMDEQGISADDVAKITDTNKVYQLAVRARRKLSQTPPAERAAAIAQVQEVVNGAQEWSRQDVMRAMDEIGAPTIDPCASYVVQKVCTRTGQVNPRGCEHCIPGFNERDRPALPAGGHRTVFSCPGSPLGPYNA
jgi:hypothetical protein